MDLATASLSIPCPSPVPRGSADPATDRANQAARPPASDGDQEEKQAEKEEPSSVEHQDEIDEVDEASRESFPASDPPAFTPLHIGS